MRKNIVISSMAFAVSVFNLAHGVETGALWDKHCASCHGKDGKGETKMGKRLGAKDYTNAKVQAEMTDEKAVKGIKEGLKEGGKERMKGFSDKLSDDDIKALVAHMRAFKK